jgi:hypothetical protein
MSRRDGCWSRDKVLGFVGLQADTGAGSYVLLPSSVWLIYAQVDGECLGERSGLVQRESWLFFVPCLYNRPNSPVHFSVYHDSYPEDENSTFFRNVDVYLQSCTVLRPRLLVSERRSGTYDHVRPPQDPFTKTFIKYFAFEAFYEAVFADHCCVGRFFHSMSNIHEFRENRINDSHT